MRSTILAVILALAAVGLSACDDTSQKPKTRPAKPAPPKTAVTPPEDPPVDPDLPAVPPVAAGDTDGAKPRVVFTTSKGDIVIELEPAKAPKTVANFLQYVDDKHFDGTIFHRVIANFMVQGGGFTPDMVQKKTREPVTNEAANGLKNVVGAVAMARTRNPHSATAQFFINVKDNDFLDHPGQDGWGYCVFGRVVEGMDVVEAIKGVQTASVNGMGDVPVEPIVIEMARRKTKSPD